MVAFTTAAKFDEGCDMHLAWPGLLESWLTFFLFFERVFSVCVGVAGLSIWWKLVLFKFSQVEGLFGKRCEVET